MFRREQTGWIGIDIGTATVKVAQLARRENQLRVITQSIVPRSASSLAIDTEQETGGLWSASGDLGAAVSLSHALQGKRAAVSMPMGYCDIHHVDNLVIGSDDYETIVRQAVESATQSSAEHLTFDIWPAEIPDNSTEPVRWNVLAAAEAWSNQLYSDVVENKFICQRIDGLPQSLARAVNLGHPNPLDCSIAALDWGFSQATFCIVKDGRPVYARVLKDCGLQRIVTSLASGLGIHCENVFGLLEKHGLRGLLSHENDEIDEVVADLITDAAEQLERELSRTLSYLDISRKSIKPEMLYLFGGGGLMQGVAEFLTRQLNIDTRVWTLNSPHEAPAHDSSFGNDCLFAQALALSALAWENS